MKLCLVNTDLGIILFFTVVLFKKNLLVKYFVLHGKKTMKKRQSF